MIQLLEELSENLFQICALLLTFSSVYIKLVSHSVSLLKLR